MASFEHFKNVVPASLHHGAHGGGTIRQTASVHNINHFGHIFPHGYSFVQGENAEGDQHEILLLKHKR